MNDDNKNIPVNLDHSAAGVHLPSTDFRQSIPEVKEEEVHLRDYIDVILRRKLMILCSVFFVFVSTLIFSLAAEKLYKASGTLEVSMEAQRVTKFEDIIDQKLRSQEFITTQVALLKSQAVASRVIQKINLKEHPVIVGKDTEKESGITIGWIKDHIRMVIEWIISKDKEDPLNSRESFLIADSLEEKKLMSFFQDNLDVSPNRDSMIVNISFISPSRELSRDMVNHLMDEYVNWKMDQKVDSSAKAREYLMRQIDRAKINLEAAEEKQHQFARKVGIVSMDSRMNNVFRQLEDVTAALGQAEPDLILKKARYEQALKDGPEILPQVLISPIINNLKSEHANLRSNYENLIEIFHPDYPDVKTIKSRMESIEGRITEESLKIFNSIRHDYLTAEKQFNSLRKTMEERKQEALELKERATQYSIMAREVETNKAIYQSLLERAKEIESMAGISPSSIQIVDKASLPIFPDKPNVKRNLLLAVVLGLTLGIGMAFLMEYFADTITHPDQIMDRFQIPLLGVIPLETSKPDYPLEKIFIYNPRSLVAEAFQTSGVSIQLSGSNFNGRCIAITSTEMYEGKTTTAVNLALSFSSSGEKVLLVDADLRKPSLHNLFSDVCNGNNGWGLSSYLSGMVNNKFIVKTDVKNLYLIPSGPIPPNPVELLASSRFKKLLEKSAEKFDRIIIDCPPHYGFADILVISRQVGAMILVSSIGESTRDGIRHFKKAMNNVQGKILGCIVNKVDMHKSYGYKSYYYSRHYSQDVENGKSPVSQSLS